MYRFRKVLLIVFLAISFTNTTKADTGCFYAASNYIYFVPTSAPNGVSVPTYALDNPATDYRVTASSYCYGQAGGANSCYIRNYTGGASGYGVLVTYSPLPCPIDDYIAWLLLPIAGLGFVLIKKRMLQNI